MKIVQRLRTLYFGDRPSVIIFSFLTVIAVAVALQQFYIININSATRYSLAWHVPFNLLYFWYWFLVLPLMVRMEAWNRTGSRREAKIVLSYVLAPAALVLVHQITASFTINSFLGYSDVQTLIYKRVLRNPWIGTDFVICYAIMIAVNVAEYHRRAKSNQVRFNQLRSQLAQSQLKALESQLHPHFLFNTLNTMSTLILRKDNHEAGRMLILLREFLRTTLSEGDRHEISLEEELEFVNRYLEIEKVRFSDKIEVHEDISADTLPASVPSFVLQPIVENAIIHGLAPRVHGGVLKIVSRKIEGRLSIFVEDNGKGIPAESNRLVKEGVGLRLTRDRLVHLFGEDFYFGFDGSPSGGMRVTISIPFSRLPDNSTIALAHEGALA